MEPFFVPVVLLTKGTCRRQKTTSASETKNFYETKSGDFMDAKWNNIVDHAAVRISMVVVGFSAWLAIGYSLLK
jgi:hypothetical protein